MATPVELLTAHLAELPRDHPEKPGLHRAIEILRDYLGDAPTMGGIPLVSVEPLWVAEVDSVAMVGISDTAPPLPPLVSLTLETRDLATEEEGRVELGMSQEMALLLLSAVTETLVEIRVRRCDDPSCLVHRGRG